MLFVIQVVCTGKEERLLDCDFPQDFGADYGFDYYGGGYNENWPAPAHAAPEPGPMENAPAPSGGLPNSNCGRNDNMRFGVICRRFEITGALLSAYCARFAVALRYIMHLSAPSAWWCCSTSPSSGYLSTEMYRDTANVLCTSI